MEETPSLRGKIFQDCIKEASEDSIKTAAGPEHSLKDSAYLQGHEVPDRDALPDDVTSEALVKSTHAFTVPTLLGIEVHFDDGAHYLGQWMKGARHGQGKLTWEEGEYEGDWEAGSMCGKGRVLFTNG
jgi:hypothetical protein